MTDEEIIEGVVRLNPELSFLPLGWFLAMRVPEFLRGGHSLVVYYPDDGDPIICYYKTSA